MGACMSSASAGAGPEEARSKEIDRALKEDEKRLSKECKILLLGAGASGKSTVLKQMKILHHRGFEPDEIEDYRKIVFSNIVSGMRSIIDTMDELSMAISPVNRKYVALVDQEPSINSGEPFPARYLDALMALWADEHVVECYSRAHQYALQENLPYFYANLPRLFQPDYKPSQEDILRVRSKTTGISETRFTINNDLIFRMFDVGGQRSERRKWASCFEGCQAVLFLASLADYNQGILEDTSSNGMLESLLLFESIVNSQWFVKTSIILFMNKSDILMDKIRDPSQQIITNFPDFQGKPGSFNDATSFFKDKFRSLNRNASREIYVHITQATDTSSLAIVMSAVQDTIVRNLLKDMAIL
ncbi:guanine nucleotide binding protein, alpha subunit [Naematelia encephala]|uniref:Guanine nucleotide binding protein, alpha subunit n=1 Tax=Naematelia encephala TaxID=71784 RepID=A0A1Y2BKW7_9TREE|nr:guanine nucleotide binding protein, alpha subunit [Naematelia encephala]